VPAAELIELPAERVLWSNSECFAKGPVREADSQIGFEHEKALADRVDEIPSINFAHGSGSSSPSDDGILPKDPALSPVTLPIMPRLGCAVGNVDYRPAVSGYFTCMFWEGERRCVLEPIDNIHKMPS
jgi:hypothetical protein